MRELTFREVIANIKDGEVWENKDKRVSKIYINNLGNLQLEGEDNSFCCNYSTCIGFDDKYKLQRKKYTFEEAFKALAEGKKVENCLGDIFKKDKNTIIFADNNGMIKNFFSEDDDIFSIYDIRNEWYIND